jgi:hypothetical protein
MADFDGQSHSEQVLVLKVAGGKAPGVPMVQRACSSIRVWTAQPEKLVDARRKDRSELRRKKSEQGRQ